jgi:hypothetical protein
VRGCFPTLKRHRIFASALHDFMLKNSSQAKPNAGFPEGMEEKKVKRKVF